MIKAGGSDVDRVLVRAGSPAFAYRDFHVDPGSDGLSDAAAVTQNQTAAPPPSGSAAEQFALLGAALPEAALVNLDAAPVRPAPSGPPGEPPAAAPPPAPATAQFPPRLAVPAPSGENCQYSLADMFRILSGQPSGPSPGRATAPARPLGRFGSR